MSQNSSGSTEAATGEDKLGKGASSTATAAGDKTGQVEEVKKEEDTSSKNEDKKDKNEEKAEKEDKGDKEKKKEDDKKKKKDD
eukprot:7705691-Ditylum_brightwellii.AAC.2